MCVKNAPFNQAALVQIVRSVKQRLGLLWHSPTFTTWGSLLVRFASVVLLLPIVLVRFSAEEVAVWQLFSALFVLGLMLDYGLAPTFTRLLSYARAGMALEDMGRVTSDRTGMAPSAARAIKSAQGIFSTMRWLYPRLALVVTLLLAILGTWSLNKPIHQLQDPTSAWIAWSLVVVTMLASIWGSCFGGALQGMNQIAPMRRWDIGFGAAQVTTSMLVLGLGGGLLALVAVYQVWAVLGVARNRALLKRLHGELFSRRVELDRRVLRAAGPQTWRSLVSVLSSHGVTQLSGVFYGQVIPAADVASYLLALRLITVVSQFSQAPFYTKLPNLAELHAAGETQQVLLVATRGMRIAHWVFVGGALAAAFGAPLLLVLLKSKTAFVPPHVFAVLALAFFLERFGSMHMQLYSLTNHIVTHIGYGVTGAVICVGTIGLLPVCGLLAFPLAMLLGYALIFCPFALHYSSKAVPLEFMRFERKTSAFPIALLLVGLTISILRTGV